MFNFFKKDEGKKSETDSSFEIELTAAVLAYEIARIDGEVSYEELDVLKEEIKKISKKVYKDESEILKIIEIYSSDSVSFYEFVEDINKNYTNPMVSLFKSLLFYIYDNLLFWIIWK